MATESDVQEAVEDGDGCAEVAEVLAELRADGEE